VGTTAIPFWVNDLEVALGFRILTGLFLAGIYPIGVKIMSTGYLDSDVGAFCHVDMDAAEKTCARPGLVAGKERIVLRPDRMRSCAIGFEGS